MAIDRRQTGLWLVRLGLAAATVVAAIAGYQVMLEKNGAEPALAQADVPWNLRTLVDEAVAAPRPRYTLVYFGDSFALSEILIAQAEATPTQLRRQLGTKMRSLGAGEPWDLRLLPFTYSGLSLWSLYYLTDSIVEIRPEYVVIECNLFNFSTFWSMRDRRILSSMLPLKKLPEALSLPLDETGLTFDTWIFGRLAMQLGAMRTWADIQHAQANVSAWYVKLADDLQSLVGASRLEFRLATSILRMSFSRLPDRNRSTRDYSRLLMGPSLDGVEADAPALQMLAASLERLQEAGIPVLVFVPPYNLDHLRELELLDGSRLVETIQRVRETAESRGARFHDAHALLGDPYFRDAMDHLHEGGDYDGHRAVAIDLARAMSEDWLRILARHR